MRSAGTSRARVVLDTNVLVSAAFGGVPAETYVKALREELIVSETIRREWLGIMDRFSNRLSTQQATHLKSLCLGVLAVATMVVIERRLKLCRDRSDDEYLSLALAAHADILVTGDADLLNIDAKKLAAAGLSHLRILTPRNFLDRA